MLWIEEKEVEISVDIRNLAVQIKWGTRENGSQRKAQGGRRSVYSIWFVF